MDPILYNSLVEGDFNLGFGLRQTLCEGDFWPPAEPALAIFRGPDLPDNIDYETPVAGMPQTGTARMPGPPHDVERDYYYAARQISRFGRFEENRQKTARFRKLTDGSMQLPAPDACRDVRATAVAGGKIKITFNHTVIAGTTPVQFNVYYDEGDGRTQIDVLSGTVDYRGGGGYSFETDALSDGTEYWFCDLAEDADGNESRCGNTAAARADAPAPAEITTVTAATRM